MKFLVKTIAIFFISFNGLLFAEGSNNGGDEFRRTAEKYEAKADQYGNKGLSEVSALYKRQAEIKRHAAKLGDAGQWDDIDWSEYHENEAKISALLHEKNYKNKYKAKK